MVTPILVGMIGIIVETFFLRRLYTKDPILTLLFTFGLAMSAEQVLRPQNLFCRHCQTKCEEQGQDRILGIKSSQKKRFHDDANHPDKNGGHHKSDGKPDEFTEKNDEICTNSIEGLLCCWCISHRFSQ